MSTIKAVIQMQKLWSLRPPIKEEMHKSMHKVQNQHKSKSSIVTKVQFKSEELKRTITLHTLITGPASILFFFPVVVFF